MRRKWTFGLVGCLGALAAVGVTPAVAQESEINFRQGYDSNVYEVNGDLTTPVSGYYSRLDAAYESPSRRRGMSVLFRPQAHVMWYPYTSSGNELAGSLLLGLQRAWRGKKSGGWRRRTRLGVEVLGAYERGLFLKRDIREELRIGALNPNIPLQNLPSRLEGRAQATFSTKVMRHLTLAAGAFGRVREYVDSNDPSVPSYSRLDLREIGAMVEVSGDVARDWELSANARWRDRIYPNRDARTLAGELVPGQMREFWYWDIGTRVRFNNRTVRNTAGAFLTRRVDRFEGHYSYYEWEVEDRLRYNLTHKLRLRLRYMFGTRNYDVYAPAGSPTVSKYHDARAAVEVAPTPLWRFVIGAQYERSISNDPIFDYDRFQFIGEFQVIR